MCDKYLVLGDLNCNMLKPGENAVNRLCQDYSLKNIINSPTCFKSDPPTLIDVLLLSDSKVCRSGVVTPCPLSDFHHFISGVLDIDLPRTMTRKIHYRSYKNFDPVAFGEDLRQAPFHVGEVLDIDSHMAYFQDLFTSILDKHAPVKTKVIRTNQAPHMTNAWKSAIFKRNEAYNTYKQYKTDYNFEIYRRLRNKCTKMSRTALKDYFTENCTTENGPSTDFWSAVKPYFSKKGKQNDTIQLQVDGQILSDPKEVAEAFNTYFTNVANDIGKDCPYIDNLDNHPSLDIIDEHVRDIALPDFKFTTTTEKHIKDIISRLPTGKAPGYDSITSKCIKAVDSIICNPILTLTNRMFVESIFPDPLKHADLTPIYKKSNKLLSQNFRPVSVLIAFSKIFELAMSDQFDPHLAKLYSKFISAYRKQIGCSSTLLHLVETWREALDKDRYVGVVMMDLSKAFDCLPHGLIVKKLERYHFDQQSCRLLHSYLENRTQRVKIGEVRSSSGILTKGVPQGSILGPKIFNCFINDLLIQLSRYCVPGNYADDNTICCINKNRHVMLNNLTTACNVAITWFLNNQMQANPEKFHFLVLSPFQKEANFQYVLDLPGTQLKSVTQAPLLGIIIDNQLKFNSHVSNIIKKCNFQLQTLKRLSKFMGAKAKLTIFRSFIASNFSYCCHIWYFCSLSLKTRLEKLQLRGLRYVFNDYDSSYDSLLVKAEMDTIELLLQKTMLVEIYKCLNGIGATYLANLFGYGRASTRSKGKNLQVPRVDSTLYGLHSIRYHGTQLWAALPLSCKTADSLASFKSGLKSFSGIKCKCRACKFIANNSI